MTRVPPGWAQYVSYAATVRVLLLLQVKVISLGVIYSGPIATGCIKDFCTVGSA